MLRFIGVISKHENRSKVRLVPLGARETIAVTRALIAYRAQIVPPVRVELERWRGVAAAIPDPDERGTALAAIDEKGLNVEATAVFAILAPRRARATAIRAMVALQVGVDYLDSLGEQGSAGDNAYLDRLFGAFRQSARALPSHGAVDGSLERAVARCGEGQAQTHAAEHGDRAGLEAWAQELSAPPGYRWWELAAGASSSVAAHALIAAAADPRTSAAEAEPIDAAYFPPIGALTVLLDDLIDREEDAAAGTHNYLAYYRDGEEAAARLDLIAHLARARLAGLRHRHRHAAILAGVAGFYLSAPAADTPYARPVRERLLRSTGPAVRPIVAFMRLRRGRRESPRRKQPGSAGSAPGQ
jgi:tetraprenyl-beta-curcumene synthase